MTRINLALQGGGAHGAFTWGVLDRLLEEEGLEIAAISGTSAGALNAAALKAGWLADGAAGARASLARLWADVAELGDLRLAPWLKALWPQAAAVADFVTSTMPVSPAGIAAQLVTPYAWGPGWSNPLEPVVRRLDFAGVCADKGPQLFIGATRVKSGRIRVFSGEEITPAVLLASACLPTVFQAVEIEGEPYWDGGYSGNPALFPLFAPDLPDDVLIVSINPMERPGLPVTPMEIQDRINEISFNAALLGELRAIGFVRRLIAEGRVERGRMKDVRLHLIADDATMTALSAGSKLLPNPRLIESLHQAGRRAASKFLRAGRAKLGHEATLDIASLLS
ncbi:patatin-like phospholipase family protein [Tabrizicola fusiformis]|uniref:patatin-like phospholipase family protein n=1 Tax=Tabrizicola sp. SY72 TaxID=2741673 RepID=UPI0015737298|nr:patatin-like phospholipase family protein [Tabrizicola sp. SY72]NTT87484.1 patatin-like phospholipase family protein [Tabrizicola sp. SY72]